MKKLIYISYTATPHQIKLCNALQSHYNTKFIFYNKLGDRAKFWTYPLGDNCTILDQYIVNRGKIKITFKHLTLLKLEKPDILILGGFTNISNIIAYLWARKRRSIKIIVFTERSRTRNGILRKFTFIWRIIRFIYRNVDMVMVSEEDIVPQFRDTFKFGNRVRASRYSADIDGFINHPTRNIKSEYTILFPNRLTDIYNPLGAISIFHSAKQIYPNLKLHMNAIGELRESCELLISKLNLKNDVYFLDHIKKWDDLHLEYLKCEIMILPARFSNGNFTIIESMASGLGIIISNNVLGVGNYIVNNYNGFRIPLDNILFRDTILKYINNNNLIIDHSKINKSLANNLGPEGTAKLYADLIDSLYKTT